MEAQSEKNKKKTHYKVWKYYSRKVAGVSPNVHRGFRNVLDRKRGEITI